MRAVLNLDQRPAPVKSASGAWRPGLNIIQLAALMTEWTVILMPSVRARMDPEVVYTVGILIKIVSGYNCGLDTEQFST